jgi:hypothetical protein
LILLISNGTVNDIPSTLALQHVLKGAEISAVSSGIKLELAASFVNPIPFSLSIGHASTRISLGDSKFIDLVFSAVNVAVSDDMQDIELTAFATFGSGDVLESDVAQFMKDVVAERKGFTLANSPLSVGFEFGVSPTDKIGIFNTLGLPIPIPQGITSSF